jgi:hypothetical protein
MVNNFQSLDAGLWDGVTAFLQDAHRFVDFPVARATVDLFFGNYGRSFLGLHKDTQEIFAFVVRGEKTILAWPFDYFVSRVEGITAASWYYQTYVPVDYRKYRKDALVLHARPGDVIYWPRDYWHIAEGKPGRFSTMLSVGLFLSHHVGGRRGDELLAFREKLLSKSQGPSCMRSQEMTAESRGPQGAKRLRWATALGSRFGSPEIPVRPRGKIAVAKKASALLLWRVSGTRVLVSANGHAATLPYTPALGILLQRLARGETVSAAPFRAGRASGIARLGWDARGETKSRRVVTRQSPREWLLAWLTGIQAVSEVPR